MIASRLTTIFLATGCERIEHTPLLEKALVTPRCFAAIKSEYVTLVLHATYTERLLPLPYHAACDLKSTALRKGLSCRKRYSLGGDIFLKKCRSVVIDVDLISPDYHAIMSMC